MSIIEYKDYLVEWLKTTVIDAKMNGIIVGVSGGIDSALVINLAKEAFPNDSLAVIMPIESSEVDMEDAFATVKNAKVETKVIDLNKVYNSFKELYEYNNIKSLANTKARLRMTQLYALASDYNYLVCGTDNLCEWYTGFFTKHGDGGVDLAPLIHLTKDEVYEMAAFYDIPTSIFTKSPSAGLGLSSTDEEELGISYASLNAYLSGKEILIEEEKKINTLHIQTEHKRRLALKPEKRNNKI